MPETMLIARDRLDYYAEAALLTAGGRLRRAVQSMIDLALQGGGGAGGVSATDKAVIAAVRYRAPLDEAAPTANNWSPRPAGYGLVISVGAAPAPADSVRGDLHFLPPDGSSPTATTTFTGSDGTAWPAPWVHERLPAGGAITVQSGRGVLTTGATGGYASGDHTTVRYGDMVADTSVTLRFVLKPGEPYPRVVFRSDRANLDPTAGVLIGWGKNDMGITVADAGTFTEVAKAVKTHAVDVEYAFRAIVQGATVQARTWPATSPEPDTWDVTATVTRTAPGYLGLGLGGGVQPVTQTVTWDDIAITTNTAGYQSGYGVNYGLTYGV